MFWQKSCRFQFPLYFTDCTFRQNRLNLNSPRDSMEVSGHCGRRRQWAMQQQPGGFTIIFHRQGPTVAVSICNPARQICTSVMSNLHTEYIHIYSSSTAHPTLKYNYTIHCNALPKIGSCQQEVFQTLSLFGKMINLSQCHFFSTIL